MADYWISFRIEYDGQAAYEKRYRALEKAISECTGVAMWDATTSFVAIRSEYSILAIGGHLKKAIDPSQDHIVLRQIDYKNTAYVGDPGPNFLTFFPAAQKI
jgi:hypothetical protein